MRRSVFQKAGSVMVFGVFLGLSACSPEVGSDDWCEDMREKDKGDWTANEAGDFLKHCAFKQD